MKTRSVLTHLLGTALSTVLISIPVSAADVPPYLSAPTGAMAGNTVMLQGRNFPANATVRVNVTEPVGLQVDSYAVVTADGTLTYPLTSSIPGNYVVRVTDHAGTALATATVILAGN